MNNCSAGEYVDSVAPETAVPEPLPSGGLSLRLIGDDSLQETLAGCSVSGSWLFAMHSYAGSLRRSKCRSCSSSGSVTSPWQLKAGSVCLCP